MATLGCVQPFCANGCQCPLINDLFSRHWVERTELPRAQLQQMTQNDTHTEEQGEGKGGVGEGGKEWWGRGKANT